MELSIGPVLKKKQSEWEDLLHVTELEVPEPEPCALKGSDRIALAALWFQDARKGRRIYYPQDNFGLICYKISLSGYTLSLYTCAILLHMSIPFLTRPNCPWETRNDTDVHFRSNKHHSGMFIPMETATIIGFICILIYYLEVIIRWNINFLGSKTILEDPWVLFRFITAILLTLGTIQKFKDPHAVTFFISLLPFVYISRRPSLRYMCRAVYLAFKECFSILVFLFFLILFFGFIGFLVFSNVQTPDDGIRANFISLPKSVMTCLHSFSARGFAIYALDPYFTTRSTSAIFFVCLSVITDIFCTALIIATGNRQFRLFADTIFNEQLLARKLAIITIHRSLATMSSAGDIKTAASMQAGNELTIDVGTWCKFATTVTSEYSLAFHELLFAAECDSETGRADCAAFCRMCAILASRKTMSGGACTAELIHKRVSFADRLSSISRVSRGLAMSDVNGNGIELSPPTSMSPENEKMDIKQPHDSEIVTLTRVFKSYYVIFVTNYISPMLEKTVSVPNCFTGSEPSKFNLFKCYEFLIRVLLIMQLVNICNTDKHQKFWFVVGWILEVNFIVEAFLNSMHLGFRRYIRNTGFGYVHVINVATFCLMIRVGQVRTDQRANDSDFIALVGLQSIRIVRFFKLLKDSALFNSILPLLLRVVVLVTCVIYFFAVFAHNRFCDTLRVSAAENNDDISDQWISYENMLNFETFPLAMFTLFEISILGNWSMVMRASAQVAPVDSLFFFYIFRLTMTLVVLPLLNSFIIQSFIARKERAQTANIQIKEFEKEMNIRQSDISLDDSRRSVVVLSSADNIDDSMMSYWSTTGTEGLQSTNKPPPKKAERDPMELELINLKAKYKRLERENQELLDKLAMLSDVVACAGDKVTSCDDIYQHADIAIAASTTNLMHQRQSVSDSE